MLPANAVIIGETSVMCTYGDVQKYPKAEVNIRIDGRSFYIRVGVLDNLPVAALIGQDLLPLIMKKPFVRYKKRRQTLPDWNHRLAWQDAPKCPDSSVAGEGGRNVKD